MKPFNLEEAKAGKPVVTGDGRNVRILCFDAKNNIYPIIGLMEEEDGEEIPESFTIVGRWSQCDEDLNDLFMNEVKKKLWVVVNKEESTTLFKPGHYSSIVYACKLDAEQIYRENIETHQLVEFEIEV